MFIISDSVTVAGTLKFTFPSKHTPATRILDLYSPQTAKIPALTVSKQATAGTNGVCACVCLCSVQSEAEIECLFFFPSLLLHS